MGWHPETNDAVNVVIDSDGQLGTVELLAPLQERNQTMETASEAILSLKPVTFHYQEGQNEQALNLA